MIKINLHLFTISTITFVAFVGSNANKKSRFAIFLFSFFELFLVLEFFFHRNISLVFSFCFHHSAKLIKFRNLIWAKQRAFWHSLTKSEKRYEKYKSSWHTICAAFFHLIFLSYLCLSSFFFLLCASVLVAEKSKVDSRLDIRLCFVLRGCFLFSLRGEEIRMQKTSIDSFIYHDIYHSQDFSLSRLKRQAISRRSTKMSTAKNTVRNKRNELRRQLNR